MPISQIVTNSIANSVSVTFTAGSAAAPAITTTSDTNTGIFFPAADTIAFAEGGAEAMRLDSSGNLLIGTTTNLGKITAQGTITAKASADESILSISHNGSEAIISASYGSTGSYDPLTFKTSDAERMRIDSSGRVQIGTTATNPAPSNTYGIVLGTDGSGNAYAGAAQFSANGTAALQLNRGSDDGTTMAFRRTGTLVGAINVTSSSTSYVTSSDYRLKENIAPMTGSLAKVQALKPCTYTWKSDGSNGQGFIAHELAEVCPDAVTGQKDAVDAEGNIDPQGIDTSFLVATLTAAIQEQQEIITQLQADVAQLKGQAL